jgi:hypothetical protein
MHESRNVVLQGNSTKFVEMEEGVHVNPQRGFYPEHDAMLGSGGQLGGMYKFYGWNDETDACISTVILASRGLVEVEEFMHTVLCLPGLEKVVLLHGRSHLRIDIT